MLKKITILTLAIFTLFSLNIYTFAKQYTNEYCSINIPSNYTEIIEFGFQNEDGVSIILETSVVPENVSNIYTEETLNELVKQIENFSAQSITEDMKKNLQEKFGEYITEDFINEILNSFSGIIINTKEVTEITENNYKCFHIISHYSFGEYSSSYTEQYMIYSNTNLFTLTISAPTKELINSSEILNIINTFTIYNYKEPSTMSSFFDSELFSNMIAATIISLIFGGGAFIQEQKKKKFENNEAFDAYDEKRDFKCKVCGKSIPYNENGTCEECHQKILKRIEEKKKEEIN